MLKRRCRECAEDYITTDDELRKFTERKLSVPGTCKKCRLIRRISNKVKILEKRLNNYVSSTNPK